MRPQCHRCLLHFCHSAGKCPDIARSFRSRLPVSPNPWLFPIRLRTQSRLNRSFQLLLVPIEKCVRTILLQPIYDLLGSQAISMDCQSVADESEILRLEGGGAWIRGYGMRWGRLSCISLSMIAVDQSGRRCYAYRRLIGPPCSTVISRMFMDRCFGAVWVHCLVSVADSSCFALLAACMLLDICVRLYPVASRANAFGMCMCITCNSHGVGGDDWTQRDSWHKSGTHQQDW